MEDKYMILQKEISKLVEEGACVAFSGGVDSSLILKMACDASEKYNKKIYAVTFNTRLHPMEDINISREVAKSMGAIHKIIDIDEFENEKILTNPIDRCYQCKKYLFEKLLEFAEKNDIKYILDGTNADDLKEYRPGIKALKELGIISPLAKLDITKKEVRQMAKDLNVSVATRPSAPCLATRLPYNTNISFELLNKIEKAEAYIKKLGFVVVRVRVHGDIVRIEIEKEEFLRFLDKKDLIINYLKDLGFVYITLDLEGFRSGSMDIQ
ncbi:MAG: ATP-dependent sacrificial sulfur transferase LarE [Sporanaerobacter sp.]|jgi:pyridinium-3,5-biscarboxylic acid mononucleotide sulfurtransferase|uniref:ATP-dependent sacrificial sulfur transferase LarE n=1 Tax=Sporanaerobacter sp. TaxID=2010183 RepID=UPI003A0FC61E